MGPSSARKEKTMWIHCGRGDHCSVGLPGSAPLPPPQFKDLCIYSSQANWMTTIQILHHTLNKIQKPVKAVASSDQRRMNSLFNSKFKGLWGTRKSNWIVWLFSKAMSGLNSYYEKKQVSRWKMEPPLPSPSPPRSLYQKEENESSSTESVAAVVRSCWSWASV